MKTKELIFLEGFEQSGVSLVYRHPNADPNIKIIFNPFNVYAPLDDDFNNNTFYETTKQDLDRGLITQDNLLEYEYIVNFFQNWTADFKGLLNLFALLKSVKASSIFINNKKHIILNKNEAYALFEMREDRTLCARLDSLYTRRYQVNFETYIGSEVIGVLLCLKADRVYPNFYEGWAFNEALMKRFLKERYD